MFDLAGKRFLITQTAFWSLRGSEMVTFELAEYLQSRGARVQIYTRHHAGAIAKLTKQAGLPVVTNATGYAFRLEDYDYIWVHHQLLPPALLEQLADPPAAMPVFLFHHMSSLDSNRLEQPYIDGFEARLAGLSLFISDVVRDKWLPKLGEGHPAALFPNPAPQTFSQYEHPAFPETPRSVLVSSNSRSPAMPAFEALGMRVHTRGISGDTYSRVSPGDFDGHDAVFTAGKTVPYCLCAGVPVYVRGYYGIPGYLTDASLGQAAGQHFCGRGSATGKNAEDIARELVDGYAQAVEFQTSRREALIERFSIDRVLPPLLEGLRPKAIGPFSREYLAYVKEAMR